MPRVIRNDRPPLVSGGGKRRQVTSRERTLAVVGKAKTERMQAESFKHYLVVHPTAKQLGGVAVFHKDELRQVRMLPSQAEFYIHQGALVEHNKDVKDNHRKRAAVVKPKDEAPASGPEPQKPTPVENGASK